MDHLPYPTADSNQHFMIKNEQHLHDTYQPYIDVCRSPYQYSHQPSAPSTEPFSSDYIAAPSPTYGFAAGFHNSSGSLLSSPGDDSSVDDNYVLASTSHMRFTAIHSSTQPTCAQPVDFSPHCVRMEELSDSSPLYSATNVEVCDPRVTVSGGEDDGVLADVALQMQNFGGTKIQDGDLSIAPVAVPSPVSDGSQDSDEDDQLEDADAMEDDEYLDSGGESEMEWDDEGSEFHSRSARKTIKAKREPSELGLDSPSVFSNAFDPKMPVMDFPTKRSRGLTGPTPVPNLTKKSRGRRVPKSSSTVVASSGIAKSARPYKCVVAECSKCFARGEHLKRHVRSIHTNEKRENIFLSRPSFLTSLLVAHKCPHPGCGKGFSRHDNLGQHMKVHKDC